MNQNVRIAKELVRIARELVASREVVAFDFKKWWNDLFNDKSKKRETEKVTTYIIPYIDDLEKKANEEIWKQLEAIVKRVGGKIDKRRADNYDDDYYITVPTSEAAEVEEAVKKIKPNAYRSDSEC